MESPTPAYAKYTTISHQPRPGHRVLGVVGKEKKEKEKEIYIYIYIYKRHKCQPRTTLLFKAPCQYSESAPAKYLHKENERPAKCPPRVVASIPLDSG